MKKSLLLIIFVLVLYSCSTTKLVPKGEYRLDANTIVINKESKQLLKQGLPSYIRQNPNKKGLLGTNHLGLYVYNWSDGNDNWSDKLWESLGTAPVIFDPSLVDASIQNLHNRLFYLGYYNASIKPNIILDEKTRLAKVEYVINTGQQRTIDSLVFQIPEGQFYEDFLADKENITIHEGDFLSEAALEEETKRGSNYFRNLGYYEFNKNNYFFEADTISTASKTILYYIIHPYTRNEVPNDEQTLTKYTIDKISIEYPSDMKLNQRKILKLNPIKPGMTYSEDLVNLAYNSFSSSNIFNSVNLRLEPIDSSKLSCNVNLKGLEKLGVKFDAEFSTNSSGLLGAMPKVSFFHKNIFRGGERLNLDFSGNFQYNPKTKAQSTTFGTSATLLFPRNINSSTELKVSYNYQNRPEFIRNISSFSFGFVGKFNPRLLYQLYPLQFSFAKMSFISDEFTNKLLQTPFLLNTFSDYFDLGIGSMLSYNSDPAIVPTTSYTSFKISFDTSGNFLSLFNKSLPTKYNQYTFLEVPYNQYIRAELSATKALRFGYDDNYAIACRLNVGIGYSYGNSDIIPYEKQFYCGGANSMRAWQTRNLGPGDNDDDFLDIFLIPSQTGEFKFETDIELRFPLFWKLEGAMFVEAGNVWNMYQLREGNFLKSIAMDWGLGARVNLDYILLRIDAGFRLRDPQKLHLNQAWLKPGQWFEKNGFAIHFGVGYPF